MTKEYQIEEKLIAQLKEQKYVYREDIKDRKSLEQNFKSKFESLNRVRLSDSEFLRLREEIIEPDVFIASTKLREQQYFQREDGTPLHYTLVNNRDWCKNEYEVINQLRINTENSHQRYDIILLVNGLPLVQIELKKLDVSHRKAMQQIVDYKNDPGNGYTNTLMCYMQMFIVSNGSKTIYFANNKNQHFQFNADEQFLPVYELANIHNKKINDLDLFAQKFLAKCKLGEIISKYMVLVQSEQKMLVMRPYQINAVEAIEKCVDQNRGNGFIWYTTGSGKTLTSFKASTLLKANDEIEKCLFVVDRKDLDRQTREEFNKFQPGSVEENTNTETLVRRLLSTDYADKVIVTTIQKLGLALDEKSKRNKQKAEKGVETYKSRLEPLRDKRMVFIFDECHRSQFGDNHKAIKSFFPIKLGFKDFVIRLDVMWNLIKVSLGGIGQFLIGTSSWVFLMRIMSEFGSDVLAGYTISIRVMMFTLMPSWGMSNAAATLVGQNLGAKQPERAETSVWKTGRYNAIFMISISVVYLIFAKTIIGFFSDVSDVVEYGALSLQVITAGYVLYAYGMVVIQAFNGAGDTKTPTIVNFFCFWLFQLPVAFLAAITLDFGPIGVFGAITVTEVMIAI